MFKNLLKALSGNPYEREIARYREIVEEVNALENEMQARTDSELQSLTVQLREEVRERLAAFGDVTEDNREEYLALEREALDGVLPLAFAAVREASVRTIGLRHFDVQIIGGMVLHEGKIAEMKTGEGKTLVASLPLYLNALSGRGAHLVTVNDYLARRDGGWMGPIFHLLGLSTGVIGKEQYSAIFDPSYVDPGGDLEDERLVHWRPTMRRECYTADITYGTAAEFGFDYLRDNTVTDPARLVQRELVYAIVDEVDSVLIDGARTPLIISGPAGEASATYQRFAEIVEKARLRRTANVDNLEFEEPDGDYILDDRTQTVSLTERGIEKIEQLLPEIDTGSGQSIYDPQYYELVHYLENALKAKYTFKRDKDYFVQDGRVILIDQTTGRPMPSRRYSEGLHQAIEAKEGVRVRREDVTIATITIQNYFRLYDKLSGMTGTAVTQAEEFDEVYKLDVIAIPTNVEYRAQNKEYGTQNSRVSDLMPTLISHDTDGHVQMTAYTDPARPEQASYFKRVDFPDLVFQSINGKFTSVADEIKQVSEMGRPILVGTGSVEASEVLSTRLRQMNLPHEVLNAKNHQREALIVAQAGRPGAITISTSMAGRGTDILLGGNPEGLAAKHLADELFDLPVFEEVVGHVIRGDETAARQAATASHAMDDAVVDWIVRENLELERKASVEDVLAAVIEEMRQEPAYAHLSYDSLIGIVRQMELAVVDPARLDRARDLAEASGASPSLIPELRYRIDDYRSLSGLVGEGPRIETLAKRLFEQHYNARAALIRAVLSDDLEQAQKLTSLFPALPARLIAEIQQIRSECENDRQQVWELGGLHVIGTERHEARRIDDQLRGRAARQGDPGSSRFYLSLEDDLMLRFGGDRTKRIMERLNIPEDMPISAGILSNAIEQAQGRFENFNFEIRKNLVEYDEAVNRQRQIVYEERQAILKGDIGELDALVLRFMAQTLERQIERLHDNYEAWAMGEIETVLTDFSNIETGEVNTRGAVQRILPLVQRPSSAQLQELLTITSVDELTAALHEMILDSVESGHNIRMLQGELARIVPVWPLLPRLAPHGVDGWEAFISRAEQIFRQYAEHLEAEEADDLWQIAVDRLEKARREAVVSLGKESKPGEAQVSFHMAASAALNEVQARLLESLETEAIIEAVLWRTEDLLRTARLNPQTAVSDEVDRSRASEAQLFSIGDTQLTAYERALMLSVIDTEWRQYLLAIDDLRQGANLEAFGQRDPKVEFKRRAFEMFDTLRQDVEEGIAKRFLAELPRYRQIIEAQKRQADMLDQLSQLGYRIEQRSARRGDGQQKVGQTLRRDLWGTVGRNDPCPCGSGKKFKDCHYREVQKQQRTVGQDEVNRSASPRRGKRRR